MECALCGAWFPSSIERKACPACERAMMRLLIPMTADRLCEIVQADKEGRLLVIPCKPGEIEPPPNNPLTLEELREMDREPAWCVDGSGSKRWAIVCVYGENPDDFECYTTQYGRIPGWCYGMDGGAGWLAYRRKPEEGTDGV